MTQVDPGIFQLRSGAEFGHGKAAHEGKSGKINDTLFPVKSPLSDTWCNPNSGIPAVIQNRVSAFLICTPVKALTGAVPGGVVRE